MLHTEHDYETFARFVLYETLGRWAREGAIGIAVSDADGSGSFRVRVLRTQVRGRRVYGKALRGAWASFEGHEVAFLEIDELLELFSARITAALATLGISRMKRVTRWVGGRWSVTAVRIA